MHRASAQARRISQKILVPSINEDVFKPAGAAFYRLRWINTPLVFRDSVAGFDCVPTGTIQ